MWYCARARVRVCVPVYLHTALNYQYQKPFIYGCIWYVHLAQLLHAVNDLYGSSKWMRSPTAYNNQQQRQQQQREQKIIKKLLPNCGWSTTTSIGGQLFSIFSYIHYRAKCIFCCESRSNGHRVDQLLKLAKTYFVLLLLLLRQIEFEIAVATNAHKCSDVHASYRV